MDVKKIPWNLHGNNITGAVLPTWSTATSWGQLDLFCNCDSWWRKSEFFLYLQLCRCEMEWRIKVIDPLFNDILFISCCLLMIIALSSILWSFCCVCCLVVSGVETDTLDCCRNSDPSPFQRNPAALNNLKKWSTCLYRQQRRGMSNFSCHVTISSHFANKNSD